MGTSGNYYNTRTGRGSENHTVSRNDKQGTKGNSLITSGYTRLTIITISQLAHIEIKYVHNYTTMYIYILYPRTRRECADYRLVVNLFIFKIYVQFCFNVKYLIDMNV